MSGRQSERVTLEETRAVERHINHLFRFALRFETECAVEPVKSELDVAGPISGEGNSGFHCKVSPVQRRRDSGEWRCAQPRCRRAAGRNVIGV